MLQKLVSSTRYWNMAVNLGCKRPLADTDQGELPLPHLPGQLHHLRQVQRVPRRVHDLVVGPVDGAPGPG